MPMAMKPFVGDNQSISKGPGPLKAWTDSRDFPAPDQERFRDWMKERAKGGKLDENRYRS